MANYNYVIDSSFTPFSMQEMMVPFAMYKDAYEKSEEQYINLSEKADKFKYLSETLPEGSKSRKLYESYANDLSKQAADLAQNGLSLKNRMALTSMRRRYSGEIGRLVEADEAMKARRKIMQSMSAQDPTMLYATDNLNIDDYLDGKTGNEYGISGAALDAEGAKMGAAISNRMYDTSEGNGNILGGYYRDYVSKHGIQNAAGFIETAEFNKAMLQDLASRGVLQNLTGANLQKAINSYKTGAMKGIIYQEQHNPQRDLGVFTASEKQAQANADRAFNYNMWRQGDAYDPTTGKFSHVDTSIDTKDNLALIEAKAKADAAKKAATGGKGSNSEYYTQLDKRVKISWKGNNPDDTNGEADDDYEINDVDKDETSHPGSLVKYDDLPQYAKDKVQTIVGRDGDEEHYLYYFKPYSSGFFNDSEAELEVVPKKIVKSNKSEDDGGVGFDFGAS